MHIQTIPIEKLKPYPNNPRLNAETIPRVAESLRQFGCRQPIVVDKDMVVIVGHARLPYPKRNKQAMAVSSGTAAGQRRPSRSKTDAGTKA